MLRTVLDKPPDAVHGDHMLCVANLKTGTLKEH